MLINQPEFKWSPTFSKSLDVPFSAGDVNVDDDDDVGAVVCTSDFSFAIFQFLLLPTFVLDERFSEAATKPNM